MLRPVRYGLIGAGEKAREHARNLALIGGSVVTAFADPDPQARAQMLAALGGKPNVFNRPEALIADQTVDAVIVSGPGFPRRTIFEQLLAEPRRPPALIDSPIGTGLSEAEGVFALASRGARAVSVGMPLRFMPPVTQMMSEIGAGAVGRLRMVTVRVHRGPTARSGLGATAPADGWLETVAGYFDLMRFVSGGEPVRMLGSGGADAQSPPDALHSVNNAYVIVEFGNGVRGMFEFCSFAEGAYWQDLIVAVGDRGKIECFVPGPSRVWPPGTEREAELVVSPRTSPNPQRRPVPVDGRLLRAGDWHGGLFHQHLAFRKTILEGAAPAVSMLDGLKAVEMASVAHDAIRSGRAQAVEPGEVRTAATLRAH